VPDEAIQRLYAFERGDNGACVMAIQWIVTLSAYVA